MGVKDLDGPIVKEFDRCSPSHRDACRPVAPPERPAAADFRQDAPPAGDFSPQAPGFPWSDPLIPGSPSCARVALGSAPPRLQSGPGPRSVVNFPLPGRKRRDSRAFLEAQPKPSRPVKSVLKCSQARPARQRGQGQVMHELAFTQSLLDISRQHAEQLLKTPTMKVLISEEQVKIERLLRKLPED